MISPIDKYGVYEITNVAAEEILRKSDLSEMDRELYLLRHMMEWTLCDIGDHIGIKYRQKPFTEGAIRYRIKRINQKISGFLKKHA